MLGRRWLLPLTVTLACSTPRSPGAVPKDSPEVRADGDGPAPIAGAGAKGDSAAPVEATPAEAPKGDTTAAAATATAKDPPAANDPPALIDPPAAPIDPLAALVDATPRCPEAIKHCVAITVHVARSADDGPLVQDAAWLTEQVLAADQRFAEIDVAFEITAATALPASQAAIVSRSDRDLLGRPHFSRGPVHVFVVGSLADVDNEGEFIRGVHWRDRADRERRWVILSSIAGSLVLTHELGHFFGLPHSSYPGSVMNKRDGTWATPEERGFHPREIAKMRRGRDEMLASGMLTPRRARARPTKPTKPAP